MVAMVAMVAVVGGKWGGWMDCLLCFELCSPVISLFFLFRRPYILNKNSMADSTSPPDASSARRFRLLSENPISRNDANCVSNRSSGGCVGAAGVAVADADAATVEEAVGAVVLVGCATGGNPPNLIRSRKGRARSEKQ